MKKNVSQSSKTIFFKFKDSLFGQVDSFTQEEDHRKIS